MLCDNFICKYLIELDKQRGKNERGLQLYAKEYMLLACFIASLFSYEICLS